MKFCKRCGSRIDENAIFCQNCGERVNGDGPTVDYGFGGGYNTFGGYGYQPFYDNTPSMAVAVLSFMFWQAGLIMWFFFRRSRPGKARSAIKGLLSSACVGMPIIGAVLWVIWKNDDTKRDLAKVASISALVGAGFYALIILLSVVLTLTGAVDAGLYASLPIA
jgi:hypothetical protein